LKKMSACEVKAVQIAMLRRTASFCEANGIKYFLGYGTLIGAVRHNGFIPWDDDIDIAMPRADYEKFLTISNGSIDDTINVLEHRRTESYAYPFAKAVNNKTKLIETEMASNYEIGVYIDIFPLDSFPAGIRGKVFSRYMHTLKSLISFSANKFTRKRGLAKDAVRFIVFKLAKIFPTSFYLNLMQKRVEKSNQRASPYMSNCVWGYGKREMVSKKIFDDTVQHLFEGELFNIPVGWHEWLTAVYGDYMQLPPVEQRVSNHSFEAFWV
jgi:lipopolysaccharide cholinephosphotransferase